MRERTGRRDGVVAAMIVAVAAAARLAAAWLRPPWHDEYFTVWAAALPLPDLIDALRADSGPPLSYLLAGLVALLGPPPLAAARALSVIAGTLAVPFAVRAARRSFGAEAGLWCGALLAVHPLAVAWSSEGRAYALLLLAAALAWERLEALRGSGHGAVGLALAIALGCWSHALGLVLAAAVAATALALPARARRAALLAAAAGLASHLPWLPIAAAQPPAATAWMGAAWVELSSLERVLAAVRLLPAAAPFASHLDLPSAPGATQALAAAVCLVLVVAASRAGHENLKAGAVSPLFLFLLPAVGLTAVAWLGAPFLFPGRSEALYLAPFFGLLAAGAVAMPWARLASASLVLAGASLSMAAVTAWAAAPPSGEAAMAAAVRRHLPDGGTIVIGGYWRLGIGFHLDGDVARYNLVNVPAAVAAHPGWYDDAERLGPPELAALADGLLRERAAGLQVAIVVPPGLATAAPLAELGRRLGLREVLRVRGGTLWAAPAQQE